MLSFKMIRLFIVQNYSNRYWFHFAHMQCVLFIIFHLYAEQMFDIVMLKSLSSLHFWCYIKIEYVFKIISKCGNVIN